MTHLIKAIHRWDAMKLKFYKLEEIKALEIKQQMI